MRKIFSILALGLMLAALSACDFIFGINQIDPALLDTKNFVLEVNGRVMQTFAEGECQMTFNASRNEFRVGNDKMTDYYILQCSKVPTTKGETLTANLEWTLDGSIQSRSGLLFSVEQVGDDGRIWLWDAKDLIGAIVYKSIY